MSVLHQLMIGAAVPAAGGLAVYDDFTDGTIDAGKWTQTNVTDVVLSEADGVLKFTGDGSFGSGGTSRVASVSTFDFTGKTVEVDLATPGSHFGLAGDGTEGSAMLGVYDTSNGSLIAQMFFADDLVYCRRWNTGSSLSGTTGAWTADTKWQIKHNDPANTWTFSTWDGAAWQARFTSGAANWNPTSVRIKLEINLQGTTQQSSATHFDNVKTDATF